MGFSATKETNWTHIHQGGTAEAIDMMDFRQRSYSPTLMRWMEEDPDEYVDGPSFYEYVGSNPSTYLDPSGLWLMQPVGGFGSPVHEGIAWAAANAAGYDNDVDAAFIGAVKEGAIWPDAPDGVSKFLNFFANVSTGTGPLETARATGAMTTYRSHFGDLLYLHGMAVPGKNCKEMVGLITDWIVGQYQLALDAKDARVRGTEIGKALHTLADTYAPSHTSRVWRNAGNGTMIPLEISRFQDYAAQDHKKHGTGDVIDQKDPIQVASTGLATGQSAKLLTMLRNRTPSAQVRKWLTEGDLAPLNLSKTCECGGTDAKYAK